MTDLERPDAPREENPGGALAWVSAALWVIAGALFVVAVLIGNWRLFVVGLVIVVAAFVLLGLSISKPWEQR
jgi:ABC-type multidrug transport system permease subunit